VSLLSQYDPQHLANAIGCAVGASGIGILWGSLRRQDARSALEATLEAFLALACGALLFRASSWLRPDLIWLDRCINLCVTLLPLVFLLYSERMLRRHAPRWFKIYTASGCAVFFALSLNSTFPHDDAALFPFIAFMAGYYVTITYILLARSRRGLFEGEKRIVHATVVAFWAMVPLLFTEFVDELALFGQRWGAVAALSFVYVNVRYQDARDRKLRVAFELLAMAAQAIALALLLWMLSPSTDPRFGAQLVAILCAVVLTYQILSRARAMRASSAESRFVRWLSDADLADLDAFLDEARARGELAVVTLDPATYDLVGVRATFQRAPHAVARDAWLRRQGDREDEHGFAAQQVLALLTENEMTHAAFVDASPPRVLMINSRRVAREGREEIELAVMRNVATLLAEARHDPTTPAATHDATHAEEE
jgi:hypothetical protein